MRDQRGLSRGDRLRSLEAQVQAIGAKLDRLLVALAVVGALFLIGKACRWW